MSSCDDPWAHALRDEYDGVFGGDPLPVPTEMFAEDLLGLAVGAFGLGHTANRSA
jgi:hypothetical protein